MARYIEIDEKKVKRLMREAQQFQDDITCVFGTDFIQKIAIAENKMIFDILKGLVTEPTEDVVPRSEVEKIFEEIHKEIELALDSNYKARQEHIDKHFKGTLYVYDNFISLVDGKIQALRGIQDFLDELKKKYIGE